MSKSERANDLFILETLRHCNVLADDLVKQIHALGTKANISTYVLQDDIDRCIKILEDRKK